MADAKQYSRKYPHIYWEPWRRIVLILRERRSVCAVLTRDGRLHRILSAARTSVCGRHEPPFRSELPLRGLRHTGRFDTHGDSGLQCPSVMDSYCSV
jgi:hypothetical protein